MQIAPGIAGSRAGAELPDQPVARELAALLPPDLVFNDVNNVGKVATLGRWPVEDWSFRDINQLHQRPD